jgi:hypothetical protein
MDEMHNKLQESGDDINWQIDTFNYAWKKVHKTHEFITSKFVG